MARLKELAIGRGGDSFIFDPEMIEEKPGYNCRNMDAPETVAHIRKMADAIHAGGTAAFPPITIHQEEGKIYVVAGYCRRRAFVLAKQEGAPVKGIMAVANTQNEAERALDLLNSNDGLPLTMMEQAHAVQRLRSFQWEPAEIAKRRGVSVTAIQNLLSLLDVPAEVKQLVTDGKVSASLAVKTVKKEGEGAAETLNKAVEKAKGAGKERATAKHLPKAAKPMSEAIEPEIPVSSEAKEEYKPSPEATEYAQNIGINWEYYGPLLKSAIEAIRDADTPSERSMAIADAVALAQGIKP